MILAIKIGMTLGALIFWWLSQKWIGTQWGGESPRIRDRIHDWLEPWHQRLIDRPKFASALLFSSSLVIDLLGGFLILTSLFGSTIRPLLSLIFLFTLRQVNQVLTGLPAPEKMIWRNPGFPSVFVTYGVTNDLFFSGHTAIAVLGALELSQDGFWPFGLFGLVCAVFEIGTVLVLRAHWTMDVFAGIVTALLTHELMFRWAPSVDQFLIQLAS